MADVSSTLAAWSSTTASNAPAGSTTIGTGLDDNLREIQGVIVRGLSHKGSDIASVAGTTDIGAVEGLMHDITGAETITGLGTVRAGILKVLKFEGAATLTHNATSLILPGAANILCANGDVGVFISEGSGNWRCLSYMKAAGAPTQPATQAEQETGTSVITTVTPGRQQFHPSAAKAWAQYDSGGSLTSSYNMTSVTDNSAGNLSPVFATDFSSVNYTVLATAEAASTPTSATTYTVQVIPAGRAAGGCNIVTIRHSDFTQVDVTYVNVVVFGDHA